MGQGYYSQERKDAIRAGYLAGKQDQEIANEIGVTAAAVRKYRRRQGWTRNNPDAPKPQPKPPDTVWTEAMLTILVTLVGEKKRDAYIARRLGVSPRAVKYKRTIVCGLKRARGAEAEALHAEMRRLYDAGHTDSEIAQAVGRHRTSVQSWRQAAGLPSYQEAGYRKTDKAAEASARVREQAAGWPKPCHHARALFAATFGTRCWEHSPEAARDTGGPMPMRSVAYWTSSSLTRAA